MNLDTYLTDYSEKALSIDLEVLFKGNPLVKDRLFEWKQIIENAEYQTEFKDLCENMEDAVVSTKKLILKDIRNEIYVKDKSNNPRFIQHLRLYLEYRNLYDIASQKADLINNDLPPGKTSFVFENKFDKVKPKKVYEYFYKLVEKGYLSKEDLESYLILAFQDRTPPKEKITFSNKHIGNITAIFYKYYTDADSPHGKQKQYAELLGEYFKTFTTQKVMNNFAKSK